MTQITESADLTRRATSVLTLCRMEESLKALDHLELATVLRTAADACTEIAAHNLALINFANMMKNGGK